MASLSGQQGAGSKANPPGESASAPSRDGVKDRYLGGDSSEGLEDKSDTGKTSQSKQPDSDTQAQTDTTTTTRTSDPLKDLNSADETSGIGNPDNATERTFVEGTKKGERLVS